MCSEGRDIHQDNILGNRLGRDAEPSIIGQPYTLIILRKDLIALCPVAVQVSFDPSVWLKVLTFEYPRGLLEYCCSDAPQEALLLLP